MGVSRELLHMSDVFDSGSPADLHRLTAVAFWDIASTITPPLVIHDLESTNNIGLALSNIAIFISPKAQCPSWNIFHVAVSYTHLTLPTILLV